MLIVRIADTCGRAICERGHWGLWQTGQVREPSPPPADLCHLACLLEVLLFQLGRREGVLLSCSLFASCWPPLESPSGGNSSTLPTQCPTCQPSGWAKSYFRWDGSKYRILKYSANKMHLLRTNVPEGMMVGRSVSLSLWSIQSNSAPSGTVQKEFWSCGWLVWVNCLKEAVHKADQGFHSWVSWLI